MVMKRMLKVVWCGWSWFEVGVEEVVLCEELMPFSSRERELHFISCCTASTYRFHVDELSAGSSACRVSYIIVMHPSPIAVLPSITGTLACDMPENPSLTVTCG